MIYQEIVTELSWFKAYVLIKNTFKWSYNSYLQADIGYDFQI